MNEDSGLGTSQIDGEEGTPLRGLSVWVWPVPRVIARLKAGFHPGLTIRRPLQGSRADMLGLLTTAHAFVHAKHVPSVSSANLSEGQALPAL